LGSNERCFDQPPLGPDGVAAQETGCEPVSCTVNGSRAGQNRSLVGHGSMLGRPDSDRAPGGRRHAGRQACGTRPSTTSSWPTPQRAAGWAATRWAARQPISILLTHVASRHTAHGAPVAPVAVTVRTTRTGDVIRAGAAGVRGRAGHQGGAVVTVGAAGGHRQLRPQGAMNE
jgi:hypothetical protein